MKIGQFVLFLVFTFCTVTISHAQKFAYVNTSELIEAHPQVASSNKVLEAYSDSLLVPFEEKASAFQKKYEFFVEEVNAGTLSKVSQDTRAQELQQEQQELQAKDQQIQNAIVLKRDMLLRPILAEIDSIIQATGKEGNYTMIFDTSVSGALLYAQESDDLTAAIKEKIVGKS
jgi:outer membrane protein